MPRAPRQAAAPSRSHPSPARRRALHRRAIAHNWDDGVTALQTIGDDPACDYGTALYRYWLGEPAAHLAAD